MSELTLFKACATCMYLTANGEYNDGEDTAERCIAGQQKIWGENSRWFMLAGCIEGCEYDKLQGHDCEGCGDTDGGDRYLLGVFEN